MASPSSPGYGTKPGNMASTKGNHAQRPGPHPSPAIPARSASPCRGYAEGDHQLEKLEFALAVAVTRGDLQRSEQLRAQIAALGGNREEPGT